MTTNAVSNSNARRAPDIRPSASNRGAPNTPVWKNPTLWLFVGFVVLLGGSLSYLWGAIPAWAAIVLGALARYLAFTVMHESSHRVAHRNRRLNEALGWVAGLSLTVTLPVFRSAHTKHHSYTNQPEIDPDIDVARSPGWLRPLWLLSPLWTYRIRYFGQGWAKARSHRWMQLTFDAIMVLAVVVAVASGHVSELLVVFVVPLVLSTAFLSLTFDLIPHHPYDSTERFYDTRSLPSKTLNVILLGQNYHLVHHLWNTVPWYKYQKVHAETREALAAIGARVDWGDSRLR